MSQMIAKDSILSGQSTLVRIFDPHLLSIKCPNIRRWNCKTMFSRNRGAKRCRQTNTSYQSDKEHGTEGSGSPFPSEPTPVSPLLIPLREDLLLYDTCSCSCGFVGKKKFIHNTTSIEYHGCKFNLNNIERSRLRAYIGSEQKLMTMSQIEVCFVSMMIVLHRSLTIVLLVLHVLHCSPNITGGTITASTREFDLGESERIIRTKTKFESIPNWQRQS